MSKKFKSQASSARAASNFTGGFGSGALFQTASSPLSYVTELPDLSQISEPNIVVAFKNLGKKDSTTKAKALEELQEYCENDVESSVLQAWAEIYPRTSIDNSRRVRQLAHNLQGSLTISTGKRIAPLMPKLIGSWLAGTFDSDKSAARAAHDAIQKSFTTPEKQKALWSLYKDALFAYIQDAVLIQNVGTLSDERTTSPDDALAKYVRVTGTAMNMLAQLLRNGAKDDLVFTLLNDKKLWDYSYHTDPYLRRSVDELAIIASETHSDQLDWATISTSFVSKGMNQNQTGSSRQFTLALLNLTRQRPQIWTSDYTAKTAASKRIIQFLRQGSQNGPEDVWSTIAALVRLIPVQVWLGDDQLESAVKLADALRSGVSQPTERANAVAAWAAYVQTSLWLAENIKSGQEDFIYRELVPIVKQFVTRKEDTQWNLPGRATQICKGVLSGIITLGLRSVFETAWRDIIQATIDEMRLSQPETSKDFSSSQQAVIEQAKRLNSVKALFLQAQTTTSDIAGIVQQYDEILLEAAIQLLRTRNGKPYGAAAIIEMIVAQSTFNKNNEKMQKFMSDDVPNLITSPSAEKLASISLLFGQSTIVNDLLARRSKYSDQALKHVLPQIKFKDLDECSRERLESVNIDDVHDRNLMVALLQNPDLATIHLAICKQIVQSLSPDKSLDLQETAMSLLNDSLANSGSANTIVTSECRSELLSQLLVTVDMGGVLSDKANTTVTALNSVSKLGSSSSLVVLQQLNGEGTPLSIFTLLDLANGILEAGDINLSTLIPTHEAWTKALSPHLTSSRSCALSITSPLQGLLYMLSPATVESGKAVLRDQDDFSLIFRLVLYTTKLMMSSAASKFSPNDLSPLWTTYPLALQLVNEKLTMDSANEIWIDSTPEVIQEAADILSDGTRLIKSWLEVEDYVSLWMNVPHQLDNKDLKTYTRSLAWVTFASQYLESHSPSLFLQAFEDNLKAVPKSASVCKSAALLAVFGEYLESTSYGKRILNELVAEVTELKVGSIGPLVLLNILLQSNPDALETVPTQRMVFLLKRLVRLLDDRITMGMVPEGMKLLTFVLQQVLDIYGEHWGQIFYCLIASWSNPIDTPAINGSIKLYACLRNLANMEVANEDLQDAWTSARADLHAGLLTCLHQLGKTAQGTDQPQTITAELVRRQLRDVELQPDENLFSLLSSPVDAVQTAAFEMLHSAIPKQQEQLSLELILDKKPIPLPQDLMALLRKDGEHPRRYMLAWKLVFDHFTNASYKLRETYTAEIKESGHVDEFLDFTCEVLGIVGGRAVDASKFDVVEFNTDNTQPSEQEMKWLVVHNYYNTLLCVPKLAKDWFISQKNRVKSPLETWTQNYISPMIITASLSMVTEWADIQSQQEDERPMTVKASPHGSELTASIAVDPESPPISLAVSLPGTYPLEPPGVFSRKRVGVSEKNWQSWLRTIQIIIFSTGSIIEGLIAFRKNVQGALKGQSECAICYSIIGTDMQTPNKTCGTCKNMFHGTCLFRWFKSSNSSSCPLCRNNFNYA